MKFREDKVKEFKAIFLSVKNIIESQPGCYSVELLEDINDQTTIFTYSIWADFDSLEAYRNSRLFQATWLKTKKLFAAKAQAWSLDFVEF